MLLCFSSGRGEIFHKQSAFPSCTCGSLFNWRSGDDLGSCQTSYSIGWCFETCAGFHSKCVQCHCKDLAVVMATVEVPPCQPSLVGKALPQHPHLNDLSIHRTSWGFFRRKALNSSCITCAISESIKRQCHSIREILGFGRPELCYFSDLDQINEYVLQFPYR